MQNLEMIFPFDEKEYTDEGIHIESDMFILDQQSVWEEEFHSKFKPFYANVIEGHPKAMLRLTNYIYGENSGSDFGSELIDGEIDLDTNMQIEEFSDVETIYALGSRFQSDDEPLFLIKNPALKENILLFKYDPDDDDDSEEEPIEGLPVEEREEKG